MINEKKWLNSINVTKTNITHDQNQIDQDKWIETIPKKNLDNKNTSSKKYFFTTVLFVCGLLLVSVVKNETRKIQKEINNLEASIKGLKFNLHQAKLDNEVITSPENISELAKEHLNNDFIFYKKSQIENINEKVIIKTEEKKKISSKIKKQIAKKIEKKKTEIRKLQQLYNQPKEIPAEIKTQVAKRIERKKMELKQLYSSPGEIFNQERIQRWGVVQVVKLFLGIPIVPGK